MVLKIGFHFFLISYLLILSSNVTLTCFCDHTLNMWLFDLWLWAFQAHPWERGCLFEKEFPWLWSHYDHSILQTSFCHQSKHQKGMWHSIIASCQLIWLECRFIQSSDWLGFVVLLIDKPHWLTVRLTDN